MTAAHFWSGVVFLYLGLLLLAIDIYYEPLFRRLHLALKLLSGVFYGLCIGCISDKWVFVSAPLSVLSNSTVGTYGPGTVFYGIKWLPRYSSLTVTIVNTSTSDYESFDAEISTDLAINHLVEAGGLETCKLEGVHGEIKPAHVQHMINGSPVGPADEQQDSYQVIPFDHNNKPIVPFAGADYTFRIRCNKFPAKSELAIFGALAVVNDDPRMADCVVPCPYPFFLPARAAKKIVIKAKFQTSGRERDKDILTCVVGTTCTWS